MKQKTLTKYSQETERQNEMQWGEQTRTPLSQRCKYCVPFIHPDEDQYMERCVKCVEKSATSNRSAEAAEYKSCKVWKNNAKTKMILIR